MPTDLTLISLARAAPSAWTLWPIAAAGRARAWLAIYLLLPRPRPSPRCSGALLGGARAWCSAACCLIRAEPRSTSKRSSSTPSPASPIARRRAADHAEQPGPRGPVVRAGRAEHVRPVPAAGGPVPDGGDDHHLRRGDHRHVPVRHHARPAGRAVRRRRPLARAVAGDASPASSCSARCCTSCSGRYDTTRASTAWLGPGRRGRAKRDRRETIVAGARRRRGLPAIVETARAADARPRRAHDDRRPGRCRRTTSDHGRGDCRGRRTQAARRAGSTAGTTWPAARGLATARMLGRLQPPPRGRAVAVRRHAAPISRPQPLPAENVAGLGRTLFTDYLLAVELGGTLLLVATIGAIVIAGRRAEELR